MSAFATDPQMKLLLEEFVETLPHRIAAIERALAQSSLHSLRLLTHQLKGSAGAFGFDRITQVAATLERQAAHQADVEHLRTTVKELAMLCRRASAEASD